MLKVKTSIMATTDVQLAPVSVRPVSSNSHAGAAPSNQENGLAYTGLRYPAHVNRAMFQLVPPAR